MISILIYAFYLWIDFVFRKQKSKKNKQQQQVHLSNNQKDYSEVGNDFNKSFLFLSLSLSFIISKNYSFVLQDVFLFLSVRVFISRLK